MSGMVLYKSFATLATCIAFVSSHAAEVSSSDRSKELADRFHYFCLGSAPDFQRIGNRSTAMGLRVINDRAIPMSDSSTFYQKNWVVSDPAGEFELLSEDVSGGPNPVLSCGIGAVDANGPDLAMALSRDASLGAPVRNAVGDSQNATTVWWDMKFGAQAAQVVLSYNIPGIPGAVVNLIYHKAIESHVLKH